MGLRSDARCPQLPDVGIASVGNNSTPAATSARKCRRLLGKLVGVHCLGDPEAITNRLFARYGSLGAVLAAQGQERRALLRDEPAVENALSLVRRVTVATTRAAVIEAVDLTTTRRLDAYLMATHAFETIEVVRVLFLNGRNRLIRDEVVLRGSVDQAAIYVREIVHRALNLGACAMILAHNHPSGCREPSSADLRVTRTLAHAAAGLGIKLHDHIVVATSGVTSMRDRGLL